jgi:hypothetical protein
MAAFFDLLGAVLTLLTLALLAAGGYLAAVRLLGRRAAEDPLELAMAWLLAATAEAVGIALLIGALGLLRLEVGLAAQALLTLALVRWPRRLSPEEIAAPLHRLGARAWARLGEAPALFLVALHAVGYETLRGLLRPPLSWDSLMYHLLLTATWLQEHNLKPVFGTYPVSYYGYAPANGSVWTWWWMAPSHSELYVNLASLPQWLLLGLATGALARHLGAKRHWPLAALLVVTAPVVVRFSATQYVDIFTAACLLAAAAFGLRWLREPEWGDALLAGSGIGLAVGAKVIGIPYGAALAAMLVLTARGQWRRRVPHLALALAAMAALGGFFYLRNVALGVDPLALACESAPRHEAPQAVPKLPRANSVADLPGEMLGQGKLLDAFLGITRLPSLEMGLGPQTFLVLLGLLALPFVLRREKKWREGLVLYAQVGAELAFWLTIPYAASNHLFANTRYLLPCFGIGFAAALAVAEIRGARDTWLRNITLVLLAQDLLQLSAAMSHGVRMILGIADVVAVLLALSPRMRGLVRRQFQIRPQVLAVAGLAALVLLSPLLGGFRREDRARALGTEYQVHNFPGGLYAEAWGWLDRFGADGTVAVISTPATYFIYPAMGMYLERKATYINVNREDVRVATAYPLCEPRTNPDPDAWLANLRKAGVRWLLVNRHPALEFPAERTWAQQRPDLFALRFSGRTNEIYELLPVSSQAF